MCQLCAGLRSWRHSIAMAYKCCDAFAASIVSSSCSCQVLFDKSFDAFLHGAGSIPRQKKHGSKPGRVSGAFSIFWVVLAIQESRVDQIYKDPALPRLID